MKKKLIAFTSCLFLLTSCSSNTLITPLEQNQVLYNNSNNIMISSAEEKEAEKIAEESKPEISFISETLFRENFADDIVSSNIRTNSNPKISLDANKKGGLLFRVLNKSKLAQNIAYLVADYPVRSYFNKGGKSDEIPKINSEQLNELRSKLKPGDIILCGNNGSFVHAILYLGNDVIIHALANKVSGKQKFLGVVKETLDQYLSRTSRDKFVVLRYKNLDLMELQKSFNYAQKQVGKSYDTLFLMNSDTRFYCTELVYQSIMQMKNAPRIYPHKAKANWMLVTNEDFMDSPDFETIWTLNYKRPVTGKLHSYQ